MLAALPSTRPELDEDAGELHAVSVLLGPVSARGWRGLEAFWVGRVPAVRAVD